MKKVLLVGCGHMGSALLRAWISISSIQISVIDPHKYLKIKKKYSNKILIYKSLNEIKNLNYFHIIIFAVKPQIAKSIIDQFQSVNKINMLFLSVMAGKKINFFEKNLNKSIQIVRAMPNMPAFVNKGMTCLISNKNVSKINKNIAGNLFKNVGKILWLKKEGDIDKVTAISGSGPGYFFLFVEHLLSESLKLGLNLEKVKLLIYQTAIGSIDLLINSNLTPKQLRKSIAIKGGTTEAAINVFEKNKKLKKLIHNAIKAAYNKSKKLGDD